MELTVKELLEFKKKFDDAEIKGERTFEFKGQTVYVNYARYVIEYAESRIG
jgi:hypothetical protein